MTPLAFVLELYFAVLLGISGLTKVDDQHRFAATLRQQRILPQWSIKWVSRIFPWGEVLISLALVSGIIEQITALLVFLLFVVFLAVKSFLFLTKSEADCGCSASAKSQRVDGTSITISAFFVLFAVLHLWLVAHLKEAMSWPWRLSTTLLFVGPGCFLVGKIVIRHHHSISAPATILSDSTIGLPVGEHAPSFLAIDQQGNSINLDDFQGHRRLLAFVSPGCSACPGALQALREFLTREQKLIGLVVANSDYATNRRYATEQQVGVPLLTPDNELIEQRYQIQGFPFVLALDEMGVIRAKGFVNAIEQLQLLVEKAYQPS